MTKCHELLFSELFPTSTRTACVGGCSTSGRIGGIVSPFIAGLSLYVSWLPLVIFGTFAFVSGTVVYLFLPETLGRPLPETISEALDFSQNDSIQNNDETTPLLQNEENS